ncbi:MULTISPECIES: TonB-dependent siderophore receptor [Rhodanobacter]|uniref:TonB-dependent siderophore receptor n=1 Tax=Rhodanobacter TaxID=75309 RepID=UPI0003FDB6F8|nr:MULTISPECIES: TonB-dependent siderophore receptor [Rhodanobacter]KZC18620.1 TonB-dependent receptor [Rhodanobacter denitrificans]UJJ49917.1 TonB-dependent siderophore receptor [Rhodanobacter denitrificans]UJJ57891.1 TonB-dependent siderophore receptor [Rhodanobacter denitrificans]UJM92630.1 TonB-dependent siderophore receptor [Rhodanobacter denitrificans]UJM96160.1 TonB-dependent siderophore receptor [Rhodanobacter denitrificans]
MTMPLSRTPLLLALLAAVAPAHANDSADKPQATQLAPVRVEADRAKGYRADSSQIDTFGSFGSAPLHDTPAAISVITRDQIDDRQPRTLSELARSDAALGDNYAPVGYYQDLAIRGFTLDLATGYRLNDMTISGEQLTPLEDKQRVEILKGLGGLEAGVVAPGGLVNYVSKRPADVRSATVGTDSHGSRYVAVDVGGWLSPAFGVRVNAAHEDMHSWVEHADGRRNFLSLAADWKISADTTLQLDTDYQTSGQRSVSGYQLLGGTALPPHPSRTRMLGFQPWQQPVGIAASNSTARLDHRFGDAWSVQLSAGHSRSRINDNVAFAYGCFYAPACASGATPGYFFAPNGDYDVYDFRSPGDTRVNDEVRAVLKGSVDTGAIGHEISLGASAFRRTLDQRPYVYDYVGTANIDEANPPYFAPSPSQPGPSARTLTSWQHSLFALDRLHLGEHWQLLGGGRFVRLHERDYDGSGLLQRDTRLSKFLPQTALMWQPIAPLTTYLSYSKGLSLGAQAPYWTSNGGTTLAPMLSRQLEAGVKYDWSDALSLNAALYRIRQAYQFAQPDSTPEGFTFVQRGSEVHSGLELGAAGRISDDLRLTASINLIRARTQDTGTPAYEGHQVINVPRLRSAVYLDYRLPFAPQLSLLGGWRYAGSNPATPEGTVKVQAYHVFDAGLRYESRWRDHSLTWRLNVDNVFDRFYWRDTGSTGGDRYLFPGAPRLARLSLTVAF